MNRISTEELYKMLEESGYENKKEEQGIARKFISRVYYLFDSEAKAIREAVSEMKTEYYRFTGAYKNAIDAAVEISKILHNEFDSVIEQNFQTVEARDAFMLYVALKNRGASNEIASKACNSYLLGIEKRKPQEIEPKPIPNTDSIKENIENFDKESGALWERIKSGEASIDDLPTVEVSGKRRIIVSKGV